MLETILGARDITVNNNKSQKKKKKAKILPSKNLHSSGKKQTTHLVS